MSNNMKASLLFGVIIDWALSQGAENVSGIWHGETDEWKVAINGSREEIEDTPPYSAKLEHKKFFSVAIIRIDGGAIIGASEDEAIKHFQEALSQSGVA